MDSEQLEYLILSKMVPSIVIDDNGCWFKNRYSNKFSYTKINGIQSHVLSALLFLNYNLESKSCVCHKCDVKGCFNPDHLFLGTVQDNNQDYQRKKNLKEVSEKLSLSYNSGSIPQEVDFSIEEMINFLEDE